MIYSVDMFNELLSVATAEQVAQRHNDLLRFGKPIVLYGGGTIAISTINAMRKDGLEPLYVCDSNPDKVGQHLLGVEVISFERLIAIKDSVSVAITAGAVFEIHQKLNRFAINHFSVNHFAITHITACKNIVFAMEEMKKNVQNLLPFIADGNESLGVVYNTLKHYLLLDYDQEWIQAHIRLNQYFYEILLGDESFVDVGAFDGDTFGDFVEATNGKFSNYYGIEMDSDNFHALQSVTAAYQNIELYHVAATSRLYPDI